MTERDYMIASNLARIRLAKIVVRQIDFGVMDELPEAIETAILQLLRGIEAKLEDLLVVAVQKRAEKKTE